jgi:hypothetical protein
VSLTCNVINIRDELPYLLFFNLGNGKTRRQGFGFVRDNYI